MDVKRAVTWASVLLGVFVWVVLAQYIINDFVTLVIGVAVALVGPVVFQAYEFVTRLDSGTSGNRL